MSNFQAAPAEVQLDALKNALVQVYGEGQLEAQISRYRAVMDAYAGRYGAAELFLFSSPGRSEIGGNHTDHNHGKVLAGSINLDTIAAAAKVDEPVITLISEGYPDTFEINLNELEPKEGEGGTHALLRGIAAGFSKFGGKIGGFQASVSTNVLAASGLSSSASFEMLICQILNTFYNEGSFDVVTMSRIGQYAENQYWHKPSGLLDQMACAYGGLITIDFKNPAEPVIDAVPVDFGQSGYSLVIVATGGNHADLTEDYAAVPGEMKAVAQQLGAEVCRDLTPEQIYQNLDSLRTSCGDRAVLRALHFLAENERVDDQAQALREGNWEGFLRLITDSGNSSWKWLQNCYRNVDVSHQGITVALAITENYLKKLGTGATRVHGGGFAGVILTILPQESAPAYASFIEETLETTAYMINIRNHGTVCLNTLA